MSNNNLIDCNIENNLLQRDEWQRILSKCLEKKHLFENEDLQNLISEDTSVLEKNSITFEQLNDLFYSFRLSFMKNYDYINDFENHKSYKFIKLFETTFKKFNSQWCLWSIIYNEFEFFGNKFEVLRYTWGGAETCPFQSPLDTKYHGYSYGSNDYLIYKSKTGETLHIGDLLFHQITKHQFFQSKLSNYRIDPQYLINFFELKNNTSYQLPTITKKQAELLSGSDSNLYNKCETLSILVENDDYILRKILYPKRTLNPSENGNDILYHLEVKNIKINKVIYDDIEFDASFKFSTFREKITNYKTLID